MKKFTDLLDDYLYVRDEINELRKEISYCDIEQWHFSVIQREEKARTALNEAFDNACAKSTWQPAPVQEQVTETQKRAAFERFWVTEIGDKDDLTYCGLGYAIHRVAVAWEAWKAAAPVQEPDALAIAYMDGYDKGKAAAQEEVQRLSALVRAQQITIDKLEAQTTPLREECVVCGDKVRVIPRQWVGLTDEEVSHEWQRWRASLPRYAGFAKGIEAKLKEKNDG